MRGADRRQLPIGQMRREDQAGLAVIPQRGQVLYADKLDASPRPGIVHNLA